MRIVLYHALINNAFMAALLFFFTFSVNQSILYYLGVDVLSYLILKTCERAFITVKGSECYFIFWDNWNNIIDRPVFPRFFGFASWWFFEFQRKLEKEKISRLELWNAKFSPLKVCFEFFGIDLDMKFPSVRVQLSV